ncbi:MAG TPA: SIS domain-containing protein [Candidatus Obscuribacterales bacterium]
MTFSRQFLAYCAEVVDGLDAEDLENAAAILASLRERNGRLFIIGSGGGAGHASHATCDFRNLCNMEAYAPYDNVSELTARVNDDSWETTLSTWLAVSKLGKNDGLLVFSVGGGNEEKKVSMNLVNAMKLAKDRGASIVAIVGRDGGYAAIHADQAIIIPTVAADLVTPLTEGFQAVVWHLLVSHPKLQVNPSKWESMAQEKERNFVK